MVWSGQTRDFARCGAFAGLDIVNEALDPSAKAVYDEK
jgi:hypothetical protein